MVLNVSPNTCAAVVVVRAYYSFVRKCFCRRPVDIDNQRDVDMLLCVIFVKVGYYQHGSIVVC